MESTEMTAQQRKKYEEETLAAYLRKGILGAINVLRHYAQMAHKNTAITHKEKHVIGLLVKNTDMFWRRRENYNVKKYSAQEVDIENDHLDKDIANVAEFIELALLTAHKKQESMELLYIKIKAVINEHNKLSE